MIWFDLVTPKSVLFFRKIIEALQKQGQRVLVTAREGVGYREVVALLNLYKIDFVNRGEFGGGDLRDKLRASIERQKALMEFISLYNISKLVSLCSVDANRVAFGLGIPIINFYDIPLSDCSANFKKALPQARLTIPLSTRLFHPYLVPKEIFLRFGLEEDQIITYNFYDVYLWLYDFKPDKKYFQYILNKYGLDNGKPLILVREEEFKSSYVSKKNNFLYKGVEILNKKLDANFIFIPRYESSYLEQQFPFATILKEKIYLQHLLAFCDLFIGGGGTINAESCFFGTPTISTRSFVSHYDKVLIDKGLMKKADNTQELVEIALQILGKRNNSDFFRKMSINFAYILENILAV